MDLKIYVLITQLLIVVNGEDVPCQVKESDYGYVCVCNATYCDTVEAPPQLSGFYYQYSTSETSPGFTRSTGTFKSTDFVEVSDISDRVYVQVNGNVQYQQMSGIGTSLSDTSGALINELSPGAVDNFVESVFGENGVEMNYVRIPIAGSDCSSREYTYDDVPNDVNLQHWNLTEEDLTIKIPLLKKFSSASKREGGIKVYGTAWTAPDWMKTNNGSWQGYVKNQYFSTWANYHIKFLQAYKAEGVNVWGISPGNEMLLALYFGPFFKMSNTVMMPNSARLFLKKYLGPALKKHGFEDLEVYSFDDQRPFLNWWSDRMFKDQEVKDMLSGTAIHWYFDSNLTISQLERHHEKYPEKKLIYTESSINAMQSPSEIAVRLGSWDSAVWYLNNIFQNVCHWVSAYLDWNVALGPEGLIKPGAGLATALDASIIINTTLNEFYKQPIFYVLGHFSKFVLPGAYRVQTMVKQDTTDPWTEECFSDVSHPSAAHKYPRDDATTTESPFPTRVPDAPSTTVLVFAVSNPDGSRSVITYNPRLTSVTLTLNDTDKGTFEATLQSHSMNTFVYW